MILELGLTILTIMVMIVVFANTLETKSKMKKTVYISINILLGLLIVYTLGGGMLIEKEVGAINKEYLEDKKEVEFEVKGVTHEGNGNFTVYSAEGGEEYRYQRTGYDFRPNNEGLIYENIHLLKEANTGSIVKYERYTEITPTNPIFKLVGIDNRSNEVIKFKEVRK